MTTETNTTAIAFPELPETVRFHHATRAKAERLMSAFHADYPAFVLYADVDTNDEVKGWSVVYHGPEDTTACVASGAKVPELADVLDNAIEQGLDPEYGYVEQASSGSVVDPAYRAQYKEQSTTGQSCGDWLAEWLAVETLANGKLVFEDLEHLFSNNGLDLTAKWAMNRSKGWTGRYRMNGRQVLEKTIAKRGTVVGVAGDTVEPPAEFVEHLRSKHAKWLAKVAKAEAKAQEAEAA